MKIKTCQNYDVVIVGGGPSGCAAASAAARQGASTLLLEATYSLGGMGTNGLVTCFAPFGDGVRQISSGIAGQVLSQSNKYAYKASENELGWVYTSPEDLKRIYDKLVVDSGADIRFGCQICDAKATDGKIEAIYAAGKQGITEYRAKQYIDCTGDADLAYFAGADYELSPVRQPSSLCFVLTNVNFNNFNAEKMYGACPDSPIHKILSLGDKYPLINDSHFCIDILHKGTVSFNVGHLPNDKSAGECMIIGRKMASQYHQALGEVCPECFADAYLVATAPLLGVRESRRIKGEYKLTLSDYLARRNFEDNIARNCYFLDVHSALDETQQNSAVGQGYLPGESHGIPYRCLVPKGFLNLLVAGRAVSCDRIVLGSVRVMPNCLTMGEAAGTAAALAVESDKAVNSIDIKALQQILRSNGAILD